MQPTVAVWAYITATTILFIGLLVVLENFAARTKAVALRDQLRTLITLASLFGIAWWITGNNWYAIRPNHFTETSIPKIDEVEFRCARLDVLKLVVSRVCRQESRWFRICANEHRSDLRNLVRAG